MAINKVDYDVLGRAVTVYSQQAQEVRSVLSNCSKMNGDMGGNWTNETATAFIDRFNSEYGPALTQTAEALESISRFISSYVQNRQADDSASAAAIRG